MSFESEPSDQPPAEPGEEPQDRVALQTVSTHKIGRVFVVMLNRPAVRNAIDGPTARALAQAFRAFDGNEEVYVGVLTGAGGVFCSGADLSSLLDTGRTPRVAEDGDAPLGVSRMLLSKP